MPKTQVFIMAGRLFSTPCLTIPRGLVSVVKQSQTFTSFSKVLPNGQLQTRHMCVSARTLTVYRSPCKEQTASKKWMLQAKADQPSLFSHVQSFTFASSSSFHSKDDMGLLVYEGKVRKMFRNLKIFSLSTSAIGVMLQPYLWYTMQDIPLLATVPLFAAVNMFVFMNPILIHFVAKRYITELHYNPGTEVFTAATLTFFARKQTFTFTAKDVTVPDVPGLFSMLTVNGRPIFIDERHFLDMRIYQKMMGFDQPLDLTYKGPNDKNDP